MPKYRVEFKGVTHTVVTVEAADEDEAIETAIDTLPPALCAHCSGGFSEGERSMEIPDTADGWEVTDHGAQLIDED